MGFRLPGIVNAKRSLIRSLSSSSRTAESNTLDIPKGYFAVYVGKSQKKWFVIPVSYLNEPLFLDLLSQAEKNLDMIIPWVPSQSPAVKTLSFILLPA
ncbi:auxin-induced protein 15A [Prunus yedoensis var. nudiflora]|uniref:Auxin-induced protein 15A n=1 Tax=Prunus yedoensis var. nudiflora TaxID=2094558 RepID=A0A314YQU8_PRUYE|nr:auxin-induced protein 15A [Prunus yedoensis var. nudiflora]